MYDRLLSHTIQEPANIAAYNPNQGTNESRRRHPRSGNSVTAVPGPPEPTANMPFGISPAHQRLALRGLLVIFGILIVRSLFGGRSESREIQSHGVIERALFTDKYLDVTKYPFLQSRQGRDDRPDLFDEEIQEGVIDFWTRFQKPFITGKDSARMDTQIMRSVVDDLLKWRGWVAAACSTLHRPFQQSGDDKYEDLASADQMYYVAITIHSADHFLVDQLAVIVQLARRLGTRNIFVSMLDMDSTDSTPTLMDLCEAILTILGIAFRIRRVPAMTTDPSASYYPLEEAYVRNLALEPLHELWKRRSLKFHRVIWLKGFTCPNDVLESLRVSEMNSAAMVCGMDWAEHNGFFIFSDRWRTRDIEGNLFRQAKSNSKPEAGPPRDSIGTERYKGHLPFQVFCCESGSHVVDPEQSYYRNIAYRASPLAHNLSTAEEPPSWDPETQCMDSTQMWFCRDLWTDAAHGGLKEGKRGGQHVKLAGAHKKRAQVEEPEYTVQADNNELLSRVIEERGVDPGENAARLEIIETESGPEVQKVPKAKRQQLGAKPNDNQQKEGDAQAATGDETGTDIDAIDEENAGPAPEPLKPLPASAYLVPNSAFTPARILVNPRCVTTYGGVSHTQLALDLFGNRDEPTHNGGNYVLDDWAGPPDSFVCQEMRTTGGRTAPKSQRRVGFLLQNEVGL